MYEDKGTMIFIYKKNLLEKIPIPYLKPKENTEIQKSTG
jgi:hypothetical protein